jgi:hypothetical protein
MVRSRQGSWRITRESRISDSISLLKVEHSANDLGSKRRSREYGQSRQIGDNMDAMAEFG